MKNIEEIKVQIKKTIVKSISEIKSVISITFVGSFESATDLRLISDIDIIVIVDHLTQPVFNEIEEKAGKIKGEDIFLPEYQIKLNLSFGPLKFNDEKTAVFHLMIYDVEGHRKHVIESPFTCLDWEFFLAVFGKNLKDIYSAKGVQIEDLIGTRRGMEAYLDDLKSQKISYRAYDFSTNPIIEKKFTYDMDERHQKEYAYHVIKFLMLNLIKIIRQTNQRFSAQELSEEFGQLNPSFKRHTQFFLALHFWKYDQQLEPQLIFEQLEEFIQDLSIWHKNLNEILPTLSFIRHGKTPLNDGSFLGVGRNPDILPLESTDIILDEFDLIYTGSLQRTISTGAALKGNHKIQEPLLNEINYGSAEGLLYPDVAENFPDLVKAWERKEDPKFPGGGESQQDVAERIDKFIAKITPKNKIAIVTHNVVIRALIGKALDLPIYAWFKLNPGHVEKHDFRFFENKLIPALTKDQRIRYKDICQNMNAELVKYGYFWVPGNEFQELVFSWKKKAELVEPDATYLHHPVHATLFLFYGEKQKEIEYTSLIKKDAPIFKSAEWLVFENDAVTGGDTLTIGLEKTLDWELLQLDLAEGLKPHILKLIEYPNEWSGPFKISHQNYGFPFVGKHWLPHVSIASFKNKSFIQEAIDTPIKINEINCGELALFRIEGETHTRIYAS